MEKSMVSHPKLLAFAGSLRTGSYNKKLVKVAAHAAEAAGATMTYIDLKDFPMPIYDQDEFDEHGFPDTVIHLKRLMKESGGYLIASPEYNGSVSGVLKNVIDWTSRPEPGEAPLALSCFKGKVAGIMATSPGSLGGLRGLSHLRQILEGIGTLVIPNQVAVPNAKNVFDDQGTIVDKTQLSKIESIAKELANTAIKLG
jgi:NAD(P)H-dependent FMN reductase